MDALSRQEYPAMLANLPPAQAATVFHDRIKRVGKVNNEIADWIAERRKVEELYVQGLKKLAQKQPPDSKSELGIFTQPWKRIVSATDQIASSHQMFAARLEKDIETSLRTFNIKNNDMAQIGTIQSNLTTLAKEFESAQEASDKLAKKGGKANSAKVDAAAAKLANKSAEWESQAPFIFEKLQAIDESRLNHLRDVLTQLGTHETDQVERDRVTVEATLNGILEIDTAVEIHNFAVNATQGKPRRAPLRQGSTASTSARSAVSQSDSLQPPPTPQQQQRVSVEDNASQHSKQTQNDGASEHKKESGLKRFGTMLGRRRQSMQVGSFGRSNKDGEFASLDQPPPPRSRDGRPGVSPNASFSNLRESSRGNSNLGVLEEDPSTSSDMVNGHEERFQAPPRISSGKVPPGPPPPRKHGSHHESHAAPQRQDSEGFSVPTAYNDPIAQAQAEAAEANDTLPAFNLNIKSEAIKEEDDEAQAALSTVANALRSNTSLAPQRSVGTVRGRREVRNTMYVPGPEVPGMPNLGIPRGDSVPSLASPVLRPGTGNRAAALATLQGGSNEFMHSSADSIRSSSSVMSRQMSKHTDMKAPGLNSSIVEVFSAVFKQGVLKEKSLVGDIAFAYNKDVSAFDKIDEFAIRLDNFESLDKIGPNKTIVHEQDEPGLYNLALTEVNRPLPAFKYKVHTDEFDGGAVLPIQVNVDCKERGDDKCAVLISYLLSAGFTSEPLTFTKLSFVLHYSASEAATFQTKPPGIVAKDKKAIQFLLRDISLTPGEKGKIAVMMTGKNGEMPKPTFVEVIFEGLAKHGVGSKLSVSKRKVKEADPFGDEDGGSQLEDTADSWEPVQGTKKIVSGVYRFEVAAGGDAARPDLPLSMSQHLGVASSPGSPAI